MSAFLVKDAPKGLHRWLKSEATFNRRSLNQQVLVCLEWCMQTYGTARRRNPFAEMDGRASAPKVGGYVRGEALRERLAKIPPLDGETAAAMKRSVGRSRKAKGRDFSYACFA